MGLDAVIIFILISETTITSLLQPKYYAKTISNLYLSRVRPGGRESRFTNST
jgi:hypothetical protein